MGGWTFCYQPPLLWKQVFDWVQKIDSLSSFKVANSTVVIAPSTYKCAYS